MNRLAKLVITIVSFIVTVFVLDIIAAAVIADDTIGLALVGNFPVSGADPALPLMDRYFQYMGTDTLGWLTYLFSNGAQNLELIGGGAIAVGDATGYIPILMEFHPNSTAPQFFMPHVIGLTKLIVPLIVPAVVSGLISKTTKQALINTFAAFLIIGVVASVLNIIHVYMNWTSLGWKFNATLQTNPLLVDFWTNYAMIVPDQTMYIVSTTTIIMVFSIVNGGVMCVVSALSSRKK
ncbi:hypothetical protein GF325_14500 [Candidatus Bathyarchaeota archaeon]|nr:hypothetical protein [Candidatus Bathyarchaeota archaeon]